MRLHKNQAHPAESHAMYFSAGFSEDSDYTSDFNFPVNGQIPNAATSQYLPVALHQQSRQIGAPSCEVAPEPLDQSYYESAPAGGGSSQNQVVQQLFTFH